MLPWKTLSIGVLCMRRRSPGRPGGQSNFALKSDSEQEAIMAGYRAFLNALSYPIQVVAHPAHGREPT
jgi:hypothetical protein